VFEPCETPHRPGLLGNHRRVAESALSIVRGVRRAASFGQSLLDDVVAVKTKFLVEVFGETSPLDDVSHASPERHHA
jgi:hypothetical protein